MADMLTIFEKKNRLDGLRLAYIGDGNNVAHSLLLAASLTGVHVSIASPPGYEVKSDILETAKTFASQTGSQIVLTEDPREAIKNVDIVYTDVWTSMGQEEEAKQRHSMFARYKVDSELLSLAAKEVLFMHPLPAHHGEEIAEGLLNHPSSVVFDQAENRLHFQSTLIAEMFSGTGRSK